MKEILISEITDIGRYALKKHIKEFKKMSFKDRLIFRTAGYKQVVTCEQPLNLLLTINNRHAANPLFLNLIIQQIDDALIKNGAKKNQDYKIKILKEEINKNE